MRSYRLRLRTASLFTTDFVCVSQYSARSLMRVVGRRALVVRNGIEPRGAALPARTRIPGDVVILAIVGGIQPNKGQHVALDALAALVREHSPLIPTNKMYQEVRSYV